MLDLDQQTSWEPVLGLHRADHQRAEGQAFARRSAGSVAADLWLPGKKRRMRNMDHALNLWRCPKLVRGLEHVLFFHIYIYIGNIIIPTDELHHFSEVLKHVETTNQ